MKLLITVLLGSTVILGTSCSTTNQKKAKQLRENLRKYPELMDARIKTLWIPDKIEGNRWIQGHFIFVIDQPTQWQVVK